MKKSKPRGLSIGLIAALAAAGYDGQEPWDETTMAHAVDWLDRKGWHPCAVPCAKGGFKSRLVSEDGANLFLGICPDRWAALEAAVEEALKLLKPKAR